MRLLTRLAILAGLVFALIWGLANFVEPGSREMVIRVPIEGRK